MARWSLSKSKYLSGIQCLGRLYREIHFPELIPDTDEETQALFDIGIKAGELARLRYPGGVLAVENEMNVREGLEKTKRLINNHKTKAIFEGFIEFDSVLVRFDILERVGRDRWQLVEVKSTTKVKDYHLDDLSIQSYVLKGAGLKLERALLMHINNQYVYPGGELDVKQLFTTQDLTNDLGQLEPEIPARLANMRRMLSEASPPKIDPSHHCQDPYDCPFWSHCTQDKPERWVYHLPGGKTAFARLTEMGVQTIDEIPPGFRLNRIQKLMKENVEWVGPGLRAALENITYPVHHLDFETLGPAIPMYPGTRPYQSIPFQWSNHIESKNGNVRHEEFLWTKKEDPRRAFATSLLESLGQKGSICTYTRYERGILENLIEGLPDLSEEITAVMDRLWDLHAIISKHYYHPGSNGSFSMKSVLPAVCPHLAYDDLEIKEGNMASLHFLRMISELTDGKERDNIKDALRKYCERDTIAMVELRKELGSRARSKSGKPVT